jgi:hypothetical protein
VPPAGALKENAVELIDEPRPELGLQFVEVALPAPPAPTSIAAVPALR